MSTFQNYDSIGNEGPPAEVPKNSTRNTKKKGTASSTKKQQSSSPQLQRDDLHPDQEEGEFHEYDELLGSYQQSDQNPLANTVNPLKQNPAIHPSKRRVYPPELLQANLKPYEIEPAPANSKKGGKKLSPARHGHGHHPFSHSHSHSQSRSHSHDHDDDPDHPQHPRNLHTMQIQSGDEGSENEEAIEEILSVNPHYRYKDSLNELRPHCVGLYIIIFISAVALCYGILALTQSFACLGPPYLYVTHKGSKNIMKFSRDGCLIHEKVLWGVSNMDSDLRGMAFGRYNHQEVLYVADSNSFMSGVIMFGECFDSTSLRPFVSRVVTAVMNPGALHTYGIAVDQNGDVYASFQKSDAVLRFTSQTFQPIPNRPDLTPIFYFDGNITEIEDQLHDHKGNHTNESGHDSDKNHDKSDHHADPPNISNSTSPSDSNSSTLLKEKKKKEKEKEKEKKHKDKEKGKDKDTIDNSTDSSILDTADSNDDSNSTTTSTSPRRILQYSADHPHPHRFLRTIKQPHFDEVQNISAFLAQQKYGTLQPSDYYNGTFVQFGFPNGKHDANERGVRAIVWVKNYTELWIANEDLDSVVIVDREGKFLSSIIVKNPIGLYHSEHDHPNLIFVGSKQKKLGGVFALDINSRKQVRSYQSIGMNHPTGIASYRDVLFVGDQSRNAVITFNITTTRVIKLIIPSTKLRGEIEHITLSHC